MGLTNKREKVDIDQILDLDTQLRSLLIKLNEKRAQRNSASEKIGLAKKSGVDASDAIASMQEIIKNY